MKLNQQVRLYPNKTMQRVLDSLCDYRRYCWNAAIACWNNQYEERLIGLPQTLLDKLRSKTEPLTTEEMDLVKRYPPPSHYSVRNELVSQKKIGNIPFLLVFCNKRSKMLQKHGICFSNIKTP